MSVWNPWPQNKKVYGQFFPKSYGLKEIEHSLPTDCQLISLKQTHSTDVLVVGENWEAGQSGDALITQLPQKALTVHTADCMPLIAFGKNTIGACHAGWRGLSSGIIEKWVQKFFDLGENPHDLQIAIGPHIRDCHFEVGKDVGDLISKSDGRKKHPDPQKIYIDIETVALKKLTSLGITQDQVVSSSTCTFCDEENSWSYRRSGPKAGRLEAVIFKAK